MSAVDASITKLLPAVRGSPSFQLDVHLQCERGITALFGPSGSGKTLFLNCLGGFARPDRGRVMVDGQIYFDATSNINLPPERRRCAYIFQEHALFPHMTVRKNLQFAALSAVEGRLNSHRKINELLEAFDLSKLANRKPAQLSGGQMQRAALARILITEPKLILLDEPSRGLDARLRESFWGLLRSLRERVSAPILLVTHDAEEFCQVADSLAILEEGRCLQSGPLASVLRRPVNVSVAQILGLYNVAAAQILALDPGANTSQLRVPGGKLETEYLSGHLIGDSGYVCVPRSEMSLTTTPSSGQNNRLTLRLQSRVPSPFGVQLTLEGGFTLTVPSPQANHLRVGDALTVSIPPSAISFLAK